MLAEVNWFLAIPASIFGTFCLGVSLVLCMCGCRTKDHKDDLVGVEGRVKITNPDDYQQEVNANNISVEPNDKTQNTAKRSLPDLPVDLHLNGQNDVTWEPNGDATSELYATVVLQDEKSKKHKREKSESDSMSPSLTYSKVKKDHPYDKLKKVEHPYAQVKDNRSNNTASSTNHQSNSNSNNNNNNKNEEKGEKKDEAFQEDDSDMDLLSSTRPGNESTGNIPAATAIAGHVTASDDLPYMTPPAHFSGDSQDSGKGYTSISVREPLSAIRAESKTVTNRRTDPHYATVSDDSDDMYAAIDDPNQVYTSESETYAQINPGSSRPKSAPQPPSVDSLKQMTISSHSHSHSRQASSSSLASSTVVSSPKPEKRPANSPLPPTPTKSPDSSEDLYSNSDKNPRQQGSPRNVEDMYAKVNKKIRRDLELFERGSSTESGVSESSDSMSYKLQTSTTETSRSCHSYMSKSTLTDSPSSTSNKRDSSFSSESDPHSGYEKLGGSLDLERRSDPGYETLNKGPPSESDPEYEKLRQKHEYVNIGESDGYANSDRVESDVSDGYARVKADTQENEIYSKIDACGSDGYARIEPHEPSTDDGYAKVFKHNNNNNTNGADKVEPGYERVTFPKSESAKHSEPFTEPTYESLGNDFDSEYQNDPNYESVSFPQTSAHIEPPYQLLRECESGPSEN